MREEIERFLVEREAEGLSPTTMRNFKMRLKRLHLFLSGAGVKRWADVTPAHVEAFRAFNKRKKLRGGTRQAYLMTARAFLRALVAKGRILSDPFRGVTVVTGEERPLPEPPLSEEEVRNFLAWLPRKGPRDLRNVAHFELLYSGGLRLAESLSLDVGDIDFSNRVLHVRQAKGGKARDIPLLRGLAGVLRNYLAVRRMLLKGPDHGALLVSHHGKRLAEQSFRALVATLNKRRPAGMPYVHAHLFRHSIAVHLLRGGADIRHIQAFLGHESLDTTKIYLRLVPADLRKAYDDAMPTFAVTAQ